ncbi:MAG TPA: protein kinase [Pyrinomonadaceae bacterium]|nr:protein kinase [Pyrinomonadaceae bacterium]
MKFCPKCGNSYDGAVTFCQRDGEVLEDAAEDMTGRVLDGQYEIESFIARGGMGTLYRARHILLGDRVAIKTLKPEMRSNTEWLRRFQREGRAARRFRHPNAVTVYDLRTGADGLTYMVMEYVEGHSLDKELKARGRLTPAEAWQILEPITSALEAAHAQGVVHRDLKPENVMLNRTAAGELQVKLLDLGIAKLRDVAETQAGDGGGAALTMAGQILGTPYYMSPEQWGELSRDANPEIDGRADIYSLGVIFYELVTGEKPYVGYSLAELRQGHVSRQLPPLDEVASGVSAEFARAIEHAMAKDRADRPATAGVFAAEIRAALGVAPKLSTTANTNRGDAAVASSAVVIPDFESSQTLIRENINATNAPRAGVETAPQKSAPQASANAAAAQQSVAQTPKQTPLAPVYAPTVRRSSGAKWIVGGAFVLLLFGLVVAGGWFAWSRWQARSENRDVVSNGDGDGSTTPARVALLDYWLEAFDDAEQPASQRVAANVLSLRSGQQFKFHFKARERGFLYIVGPGAGNAPTTFLTARPAGIMKTNLAAAGADFIFPYGEGQVLELDKNPGTEEYVVIYSRTPLLEPAFLAASSGHELTPAELKELEDLRARSKTAAQVADVKESGATGAESAAVTVFVSQPAAGASGEPVVFDIRIEHR